MNHCTSDYEDNSDVGNVEEAGKIFIVRLSASMHLFRVFLKKLSSNFSKLGKLKNHRKNVTKANSTDVMHVFVY